MKIYIALAASVMRDANRLALSSVEMGMGKSGVQRIMGFRSKVVGVGWRALDSLTLQKAIR